jgi:hypothetical protein
VVLAFVCYNVSGQILEYDELDNPIQVILYTLDSIVAYSSGLFSILGIVLSIFLSSVNRFFSLIKEDSLMSRVNEIELTPALRLSLALFSVVMMVLCYKLTGRFMAYGTIDSAFSLIGSRIDATGAIISGFNSLLSLIWLLSDSWRANFKNIKLIFKF